MAIDSHQKRRSILHLAMPWRGPHIVDGSVGQGERQAGLFLYSGILWDELAVVVEEAVRFTLHGATERRVVCHGGTARPLRMR